MANKGKYTGFNAAPKKKNRKAAQAKEIGDNQTVGHAMFEDEDDAVHEVRSKKNVINIQVQRSTRVVTTKTTKKNHSSLSPKKPLHHKSRPKVHLGKLKQKVSQENRKKKRRREAEEADLYSTAPQRKGTSNRKERGAARDRMPHVIMSDKIEAMRLQVEKRPDSIPFHRPVNRKKLPKYYEIISEPIDLQTIRDKNGRYEYRTVDAFVRDFDLMKNNAIKFNGSDSVLGKEAKAIYEIVKTKVQESRNEFTVMEEAVKNQLSAGGKRHKKQKTKKDAFAKKKDSKKDNAKTRTANIMLDGVNTMLNLGDISTIGGTGEDTDSDDSEIINSIAI